MNDTNDPDLLRRLREGDLLASSEFAEQYLEPVVRRLRNQNSGIHDEHLIYDAAAQAVMAMIADPHAYNPDRLNVLSYLVMAAQGDLRNLLAKEQRRVRGRTPLEVVEQTLPAGNDEYDGDAIDPRLAAMRDQVLEAFPDERDRKAVEMIIEGVRRTTDYARVYGLQYLSEAEQRREVNKIKDRIKHKIGRLRKELLHERG